MMKKSFAKDQPLSASPRNPKRGLLVMLTLTVFLSAAWCLAQTPAAPAPTDPKAASPDWTTQTGERVELTEKLGSIKVYHHPDGTAYVSVRTDQGRKKYSPEQFVQMLEAARSDQKSHGFLFVLLNITSWTGVLWVSVGFLGQALFTFRMVLQWLVSEKHGKSIVPVSFWWGSLFGGLMLLTYFLWRRDIVGIVGQSTGAFVYARNLMLIYAKHKPSEAASEIPEISESSSVS